ncbi:MAG: hypothetical protein ACK5YR_22385 [Pirellula sp.]|jgi:hypothetical protein
MPLQKLGSHPLFLLMTSFLCAIGLMLLYAVYLELKHGRTGWLRVILAAGIVYGLADEFGFNLFSPPSLTIVCSILFSAAWLVDVIERRERSNATVSKD